MYKRLKRTYLDELHEEDGQKIFFLSAYASASKGLNPIIKTKNGEEKDFDLLVLLMNPYYTKMKTSARSSKTEKEPDNTETFYHFAYMTLWHLETALK